MNSEHIEGMKKLMGPKTVSNSAYYQSRGYHSNQTSSGYNVYTESVKDTGLKMMSNMMFGRWRLSP